MSGFRISAWAIRNPVPVAILFVALVLVGIAAYVILPVKLNPDINFPAVAIRVTQSGAAPSEMETQVTRPIENALAGLSNVETLQSVVGRGSSTTSIEFALGQDMQKATEDVRNRVEQTRVNLPRDIDPPTVERVEIDSAPIVTYAVSADAMSGVELSWFIDDTAARALQSEPGVAQISRLGGVNREINVVVDPDALAARGLTANQVSGALRTFSLDAPGGQVEVGGRRQTLRVLGSAETVAELRDTTIPTPSGGFVRLSEVAEIGDGSSEVQGFARLDGAPVVAMQVMKTREASDVETEDNVLAAIEKLEAQYPGVRFTKIVSTVDETRSTFEATLHTLLEGMLLASLVVFLFLKEWRATLITAIAMPASLIPTFMAMMLFGFSLNFITLLALTLVIGILVDDAIVEIENIQKRINTGQRPYHAALEGADQIGLAVVATTATIVVVFLPVSFMPGIPGQFFREFGLTVSVAVLFSLLTARLLTPLLAAYFLKPTAQPHERPPLKGFYRDVLEWCLSHKWVSIAVGGLIFIGSLGIGSLLPTGVQPASNPDYYYISIEGPPGSTPATMDETVTAITRLVADRPETSHVFAQVGSTSTNNFFGGGASNLSRGTVTVVLKPYKQRETVTEIKDRVRPLLLSIPDARVSFDSGGFGQGGIQVTLTSENGPVLERTALQLQREMATLKSVANPVPAAPAVGPEIVIRPKPDEAARLGVSIDTIAAVTRIATLGDIDANVAKFNEGSQRIPIRVRLPEDSRRSLETLESIQVPTIGGRTTALANVAEISFQAGPAQIDRYDRKRQITIQGDLAGGAQLGDALGEVRRLPVMRNLPAEVTEAEFGENRIMVQLFTGLAVAILAGILMNYAVMILLFRSFFKPAVILSALPLAIGGAFLGLLLFGMSLDLPSLIGFLMLLGLAAKNSILLVEYAIEREREGMPQRQALIDACRERARPIVMTTLAMQAGMLPTALGLGAGAEFRQPMAVAVIGGLITSTVLSLVLVPVVYEVVDDFEQWLAPKFGRFVTPREAPDPSAPVVEPTVRSGRRWSLPALFRR